MRIAWLAAILILLFPGVSLADKQDVTFKAPDGFALKGTLYPTEKGGPGILLLHQCNGDRKSYDELAEMLSTAGYVVLTVDSRKTAEKMSGDVDAALAFLTSQSNVNPRSLGVVGGSSECGAKHAVLAGKRHPEIRTLVLLSGGTDAEGETYISSAPKIPVFGIASEEDTSGAAAVKKVVGLSKNPSSRVEMLKGAGHAASMFEKEPGLEADIVIFFRSNLPVGGYGLPPAIKK